MVMGKSRRSRVLFASLLLVLVAMLWWWPQSEPLSREPVNGRLPDVAVPDHYLLRLNLFPEQEAFRGEVEIQLQLRVRSQTIFLHGRDLNVLQVEARQPGRDPVPGRYQQLSPQGLARIDFDAPLPAGFLSLHLQYDGRYTQTAEGLSRIQIDDRWYVFSQLHPIEARRVFPGFDEPRFKASFDVEVISWRDDLVIGNSLPSETRYLANNFKLTRLNRTPRLPSYVLNISVGPFDVVNGSAIPANDIRPHPLPLRAITTRGNGGSTRFALDHTAAMLSAFERYFAIPFPFDKLDLVAVPSSSANVLENAGAINFLDQLMLVDEPSSEQARHDFIAHNAHALAHQWFGDLVTMPWWDDLWLNEGFAEWLGYRLSASTHPEYPLALAMQKQIEHAMQRDGISPHLPVRQRIVHEQDVLGTFNSAVYDKATGLMQMYQHYLGEDQFREGLRNYFARHAFGNAGANELLQSLADVVADPTVIRSFDSFLRQPGLPQIRLRQHCHDNDLQIHLQQQRYRVLGADSSEERWSLPVCLRTLNDSAASCRLLTELETVWSPGWRCEQLVLPNADAAGYYRWHVEPEHRQRLLANLSAMPLAEALDVVANLNAGLRAGILNIDDYWQSLPALSRHPQPEVLAASLDTWRYLLLHVANASQRAHWQPRLQAFFAEPRVNQQRSAELLQFRTLVLQDKALRASVLKAQPTLLSQLENQRPLVEPVDALALAIAIAEQPSRLPALLETLQQEQRTTVRAPIVQALAWQNELGMLPSLQALLQSPQLHVHERWQLLEAMLTNPAMQTTAWQALPTQLTQLLPLLPEYRHSQLPELAQGLCDQQVWLQVQSFLQQQATQLPIRSEDIQTAASHVQLCLALQMQLASVTSS